MAYARKVRTASGAVAVQVVRKHRGQRTFLARVGSAHTDAQLGILLDQARRIAAADQSALDIEVAPRTQRVDDVADWRSGTLPLFAGIPKGAPVPPGRTTATCSCLLYDTLDAVYDWLGFDIVDDVVFRDTTMRFFAGPTLLVIDELGYLLLPAEATSALFQVVSQRYLKNSIVITTNRGVGAWGEVFGDTTVAAAMLDRLLHRSVVINLDGESYRLRDHQAAAETLRRTTIGTRQELH